MIVAEIFPLRHSAGSQKSSHCIFQQGDVTSSVSCSGESGLTAAKKIYSGESNLIITLHYSAGSQILTLHDAAVVKSYHRMMQQGVNLTVGSQV